MRLLRSLRLRARVDRHLNEELQSHIANYVEDLVARGVPVDDANRRARAEFGGIAALQEECRDASGLRWLTSLRRDVGYGLRLLRKCPGFAATAILTLGLCIGANTAIFSVVDAVLLRPLPYPEPHRLGQIVSRRAGEPDFVPHSAHVWQIVRDDASTVDVAASAMVVRGANLLAGGLAEHLQQQRVSANFFRVLGVAPAVGREFDRTEDRPGGPAAVILSNDLWRRAFAGDPAVVGRQIALKGEAHTVVGVMPAAFQTIGVADVWTPLRASTNGEGSGSNFRIIARLKNGITWAQASTELQALGASAPEAIKKSVGDNFSLAIVGMQEGLALRVRTPLMVLWGAVGLVLLIGCANIASLLLARAANRKREIATRMAIGGGSGVLFRQLLTESVVLATAGGLIGIAVGYVGVRLLRVTLASSLGLWQTISLDERVLAVTFAISLITSVLFGTLPAWEATRVDIRTALVESDARTVAGRRNNWPRRLLVAGEVSLGMVLLVAATLLLRTFINLMGLSPGFDSRNVMTARVSLDDARYRDAQAVLRLYDESLERIRHIPGVELAAVSLALPYERALNTGFLRKDGPEAGPPWNITNACYVTGDYFATLRIPLLRGRYLNNSDATDSTHVALINESFARRYLSRQEPVGSHIQLGDMTRVVEIVGVVGDVQQKGGWGNFGPLATIPQIYFPALQTPSGYFRLAHTWFAPAWLVRTKGPYAGLPAAIQQSVHSVDSQLPFAGFQTLDAVRSEAVAQQRFQGVIVSIIAALALILAALGVYGMVAQTVAQRTRELGIRMALGATAAQGIRSLVAPTILLVSSGVVAGIGLSRAAGKLLEKIIWGVNATDPFIIAGVGAGLLVVAAMASLIPAMRLTRLNPTETLRHE